MDQFHKVFVNKECEVLLIITHKDPLLFFCCFQNAFTVLTCNGSPTILYSPQATGVIGAFNKSICRFFFNFGNISLYNFNHEKLR